jgi:hypothetical protein
MKPVRINATGSSIAQTEFDGEWIYPRKPLTPRLSCPGFQALPGPERFRRYAEDVSLRCRTRIDRRSIVQRKTATRLVSP